MQRTGQPVIAQHDLPEPVGFDEHAMSQVPTERTEIRVVLPAVGGVVHLLGQSTQQGLYIRELSERLPGDHSESRSGGSSGSNTRI